MESQTLKWLRQSLGLGDPRTSSVSLVAVTVWTGYCSTLKEEKTLFILWVWGCFSRCGPRVWILDSVPASPVKTCSQRAGDRSRCGARASGSRLGSC